MMGSNLMSLDLNSVFLFHRKFRTSHDRVQGTEGVHVADAEPPRHLDMHEPLKG